jgi:UDP-3-O-[3-hydroxymyristoyl] glucosamine N-acyltransferase
MSAFFSRQGSRQKTASARRNNATFSPQCRQPQPSVVTARIPDIPSIQANVVIGPKAEIGVGDL